MDIRLIKRIIKLVEESEINELEVEEGELRISVCKQAPVTFLSQGQIPDSIHAASQDANSFVSQESAQRQDRSTAQAASEEPKASETGVNIPSPMVGTFYRAPSPDDPVYVQVGSVVEPDSVVCILEAMKVMNEIKAGVTGKVVEVLVENGNPVEFGQPLFRVEP